MYFLNLERIALSPLHTEPGRSRPAAAQPAPQGLSGPRGDGGKAVSCAHRPQPLPTAAGSPRGGEAAGRPSHEAAAGRLSAGRNPAPSPPPRRPHSPPGEEVQQRVLLRGTRHGAGAAASGSAGGSCRRGPGRAPDAGGRRVMRQTPARGVTSRSSAPSGAAGGGTSGSGAVEAGV